MTSLGSKTDKALSFDEMATADDNMLHNSNMLNLVSAAKSIDADIAYMTGEIDRLTILRDEIKTFATDPKNLQNTREVSRLFKERAPREQQRTRY